MTSRRDEEAPLEEHRVFRFPQSESGERLDKWLVQKVPHRSRTEIQRWIREGRVWVNGHAVKPGHRLEPGDLVEVSILPSRPYERARPQPIPLTVVYEDEDILVVDKPAGMVVHPGPGQRDGTLVNAVLYHVPDLEGVGGVERPGIVHRLDKDTSGLIVVAKNDRALRDLQRQFKERTVEKVYLALVEGHLQPNVGRIEVPIGRDKKHRKRMTVTRDGREAVTEYRLLRYYDEFTLVEVHPLTGRTHQIRVHFAFIGHPVAGDALYGPRKQKLRPRLQRHFLHAHRLRFRLPGTGQWVEFISPLPDDLQQVLDSLHPSAP